MLQKNTFATNKTLYISSYSYSDNPSGLFSLKIETECAHSVINHVPEPKIRPPLKNQICDNVLPGHTYGTRQVTVIFEHGTMVKWSLTGKSRRKKGSNLLHCHFIHQNVP